MSTVSCAGVHANLIIINYIIITREEKSILYANVTRENNGYRRKKSQYQHQNKASKKVLLSIW